MSEESKRKEFLKKGAVAFLSVPLLPAILWGASEIITLKERAAKTEEKVNTSLEYIREGMQELKDGQNEIRSYIINKK